MWINTYQMVYPSVPYGGVKMSGHGRTLGAVSRRGDDHGQERLDGGSLMGAAPNSSLQDRLDVADAIYRYASTIDTWDNEGLRAVLADDLWAQYGNAEPITGGDTVAEWIAECHRGSRRGSTTC